MAKVNTLLTERLKKREKSEKMATMAKQSAAGHRSGFSGIFSVIELSNKEKGALEELLQEYATDAATISHDLKSLISLTSEVKAINNQAAILHGERIKKAHAILTRYRDGAFTCWLIATYGNRQTPYNFMQYYNFYHSMPKPLRLQIEAMPRQAIYTLASRKGSIEQKKEIVKNYKGETKTEILVTIRNAFPLKVVDKRKHKIAEEVIKQLKRTQDLLTHHSFPIIREQKNTIYDLLADLHHLVNQNHE